MHRIDGPAAAPGGVFTDGDPAVGTPATVVTDDWLNAVQEEIVAVIASASIGLVKANNAQLLAAIQVLTARAVPPGAIQAFGMSSVPAGWLACNGAVVSRSAYPALFAAIGVTYGPGDGSTTFGLPDLRGEFLRGVDAGRGVDVGRALGSAQADELKSHDHDVVNAVGGSATYGVQLSHAQVYGAGQGDELVVHGAILARGGVETRPRNVSVAFAIRT